MGRWFWCLCAGGPPRLPPPPPPPPDPTTTPTAAAWPAVFLFVCIAAGKLALLAPRVGLPLITGYCAVGVLAGPYALNLLTTESLKPLSLTNQFALAFIAMSAGAELYLPELRALFRRILGITL
jgi:Kef-type K+ transport system membrane component KefB